MNRNTRTLIALTAGCMISSLSLAQMDTTGKTAEDPNRSVTPSDHPMGAGKMDMASGAMAGGMNDEASTLKSFAQDPKTACDKMFVYTAGIGNKAEVELAKLAEGKSNNEEVKKVAMGIEKDHTKAQEDLQKVADSLDVKWPAQLPPMKQEEAQLLAKLPEDEFNKHYITMMQADHAKDAVQYRAVANGAMNDQVKMYAGKVLPDLLKHAAMIDKTASTLGLPAGNPMSAAGSMDMSK